MSDNTEPRIVAPCVGCRQQDICICMIPWTPAAVSSRGVTPGVGSSRKRSHTHEPQKKPSVVSVGATGSSPTVDKSNRIRLIPNHSIVQFPKPEYLSPVSVSAHLENGIQSPVCNNELSIHEVAMNKLSQEALLHEELCSTVMHEPHCSNPSCASPPVYPPMAYNLLLRLLDPNPATRITTEEALAHPFLNCQAVP